MPVDDSIEPVDIRARDAVLVGPMRRNTPLRTLVHIARSDLHFYRLATRTNHRRVQRLIQIKFRHCDVILKPANYRFPMPVDAT